ncbi:MAG: SUF system NifU family Fe-S cluster assembly protein [Candidatus Neomarinimicrobiota bacterium]
MISRDSSEDNLRDLYQELILDHNRSPRNFRVIEGANRRSEGYNPLCGDKITVYVLLEDDIIKEIGFQGSGCAISKASASIMTTSVKGKTKAEAKVLFGEFHKMATTGERKSGQAKKLAALAGVHKYPVRVKCATLAWHTLRNSLQGISETVTTE